ncbi:hypothetical protein [Streptomyces sp. NBC_00299]|uniref:hypothetical protein n=1 Tax=Streptomyces sp. NBC_00299 TaxID=2975705 RepID=UPI002E297EE2|nr:hypothetical protein [Streptomyces sp. NBC_00299]
MKRERERERERERDQDVDQDVDLDTVADELYGLRPEEFIPTRAARAAAARTAGDRALATEIGKLRRPSLSAWASNLLVRERRSEVEPLLRLGEGLRQAHQDLDGAQLRELSRQQRILIGELSRQAGQLAAQAGHPISDAARHEVESTLHAALADPEAAREWASGRLTKPFSSATDFPTVAAPATARRAPPSPATESHARRPSPRDTKADKERRRRLTQARKEADKAARELRAQEDETATATRQAFAAKKHLDETQQRVAELTAELQHAKTQHQQARTAEQEARNEARTADRRLREARRRAEGAAGEVQGLEAGDDQ